MTTPVRRPAGVLPNSNRHAVILYFDLAAAAGRIAVVRYYTNERRCSIPGPWSARLRELPLIGCLYMSLGCFPRRSHEARSLQR